MCLRVVDPIETGSFHLSVQIAHAYFHLASTSFFRFFILLRAPLLLVIMCASSSLQVGHCSAIALRASSNAACVCWSGIAQHWANMAATCLSHPSSLTRTVIQG